MTSPGRSKIQMNESNFSAFSSSDIKFQNRALDGVSRTFALTIPQLPKDLRHVVGNAYLLCRIADTIEDEPALSTAEKRKYSEQFISVVKGEVNAIDFAQDLGSQLSAATTSDEHKLIQNTERVIRITHACTAFQRQALERCVRIMSRGMAEFQANASLNGLSDVAELDQYCYYVAGVVGEMLTELFCDYCPEMAENREKLLELAVSFGQALQMTNILKDIWDDQARGVCWLPRSVFDSAGFHLGALASNHKDPGYIRGMHQLVKIAHQHQVTALQYIQLIPYREQGIRRHCLWALGMAVLTLRRIYDNPTFSSGNEVKISRLTVTSLISDSRTALKSNTDLVNLFNRLSSGFREFSEHQVQVIA